MHPQRRILTLFHAMPFCMLGPQHLTGPKMQMAALVANNIYVQQPELYHDDHDEQEQELYHSFGLASDPAFKARPGSKLALNRFSIQTDSRLKF